jgi:hypothetical protein
MSPWHAVRIRSDLHRVIQAQAAEQSRSVAGQVDHLLTRALEQAPGTSSRERDHAGASASPSSAPARASNTSASSGGGPSSDVIPGESGRGAGVDLPEVKTSGAALANDVEGASKVDPAPLDPSRMDGQTDIYEMLGACPECAGRMEKVGDGPERCVECGYARES